MSTKQCKSCLEVKELSEFNKQKENRDGHFNTCRSCTNKKSRERYHNNKVRALKTGAAWRELKPDRFLHLNLLSKYGISLDEYNFLLEEQDGVCAICQETCTRHARLSVDHCHDTGKVRGLLCEKCNHGIGNFKDNADLLMSAAQYIEKHRLLERPED